jgi:hypothetical protein
MVGDGHNGGSEVTMPPIDPLTAALNLATAALTFGMKVWDATPKELQAQSAGDWAKFTHNIGNFATSIQDKINTAVGVKPIA